MISISTLGTIASRQRRTPLVLVASPDAAAADDLAARLRRDGMAACTAHSYDGCLRVATSVAPDVLVLDPAMPRERQLASLLRAHPHSASARVLHLSGERMHQAASTQAVLPRAA